MNTRHCACQVKTHSIIIATGATAKKLGIPSEEKFWSQGISACAICDGMLNLEREQSAATKSLQLP